MRPHGPPHKGPKGPVERAGYGFDGASDLLVAYLLAHAEQLAQAGGIELRIISTPEIGHG
jgi:hypothetical protein